MRYRSKPVFVDAFQWNTGDVIEGVTPRAAAIRFDDARRVFYIEKDDLRPSFWLSVETREGDATEEEKKAGFLEPSTAVFKLKVDGRVYKRTYLHFNFWKVKTRENISEPIDKEEHVQLLLDYAAIAGWKEEDVTCPPRTAFVLDENGRRLILKSGDWVVTDDKGRKRTMDNETFHREYERVEEGFIGAEDEVTL